MAGKNTLVSEHANITFFCLRGNNIFVEIFNVFLRICDFLEHFLLLRCKEYEIQTASSVKFLNKRTLRDRTPGPFKSTTGDRWSLVSDLAISWLRFRFKFSKTFLNCFVIIRAARCRVFSFCLQKVKALTLSSCLVNATAEVSELRIFLYYMN